MSVKRVFIQHKEKKTRKDEFRVVSLNVGYNIVTNHVGGSEAQTVTRCQKEHKQNKGWLDSSGFISGCAFQSAVGSATMFSTPPVQPDVVCFQEVPNHDSEIRDAFLAIVQSSAPTNSLRVAEKGQEVVVAYNPETMGEAIHFTSSSAKIGNTSEARGMMAVWFPGRKTVVINVHAPHKSGSQLRKIVSAAMKATEKRLQQQTGVSRTSVETVILCGDFNDGSGAILTVKAFGQILRLGSDNPGNSAPVTCCEDSGYAYRGDYIFVDQETLEKRPHVFEIPEQYKRHDPPMSDHDPVVLVPSSQ